MNPLNTYYLLQFLKAEFLNRKFAVAKCLLFFSMFVLLTNLSHAQSNSAVFTLNGSANRDTGTMILVSVNLDDFYPPNTVFKETKIEHGTFSFTDTILYPYAYRLFFKLAGQLKYVTNLFFVEPGQQTIICNIDSIREIPEINNSTMKEFRDDFISKYGDKHYRENDLLQYTKQYNNSYVALWALIYRFHDGYKPEYDSIYNLFSDTIKNTYTAAVLAKKLSTAKVAAVGRRFPQYQLLNIKNKTVAARVPVNGKYTLVDFWFSHCDACISQFPALQKMYAKGTSNGFSVIGISIDNQENKQNWIKAIHKYKLPWQQYLDLGGVEALKLGIIWYPCNFLLDSTGKIISKDISMVELNKFLKDKRMVN